MKRIRPRINDAMLERIAVAEKELARGPITAYKLTLCTGWDLYTARQALEAMLDLGRVVEVGRQKRGASDTQRPKGRIYALVKHAERQRQRARADAAPYKGEPAGPITIPQFRWGSTRLW